MILTLALRNLFNDRIRLAVTLVGILFSIVLMAVQLGMYLGSSDTITAMIDRSNGDLWITTFGAKCFEEGGILLTPLERNQALATPGVKAVIPLVVAFADWLKPEGGTARVVLVGTDADDGGLAPWSLVSGDWQDIKSPDAVSADDTYLTELGITGLNDTAQIEDGRVTVRALTHDIRSFTQSPFIFTTLSRARDLIGADGNNASFYLVQLEPGADVETVRQALSKKIGSAEVLTKSEFRDRSLQEWLFHTGAGIALIGGALLGFMVGMAIVAQTLYSSTKDHLHEFATLRALGATSGYLYAVILMQAAMSAILGYALGMIISLVVLYLTRDTPLPFIMTPWLAGLLFAVTMFMSGISALSAIVKVTKIDPVTAFTR